ncbi:E3 ubiquitin-protein ligase UPL5-like isoform X1 [Cynara cardunculus var. scolymus]|uniref:E3 ubiquitin-protein ligase UPL5-like isoform X1 n=1 Tax=Cynara cardunculus var. scolymus TaxID=59895 RepID=UPI000D628609|nr:E3 ubiquitin-protein ligase UPL5-like isoform X1 [Cynara cardunculus var. scolymus]
MSFRDSPAIDFVHQRFKRKLEDFDDDDLSSELTFVRMRKDDPNPNPLPSTASGNPRQPLHFQYRASTSTSTQDASLSSYPNRIQFFVRMISGGNTLVLNGEPDDTVKLIHEKIQAVTGIPMIEQRLIYRGRQLQWDHTLAECMIKNDAGLHLVGRMRSTEHPQAWQLVDDLVSTIYRLCKGEKGVCLKSVKPKLIEFLNMTAKNDVDRDHPAPHLNIFLSLCAPAALVMLYMSPHEGNKECAEELIRHFIDSSRDMLPKPIYSQCAPVVLEFCKLIGRTAAHDDPLYNLCRGSLASMVEDLRIGRSLRNYDNSSNKPVTNIAVEDIFPFVAELANLLSETLVSSMESLDSISPSPCDVNNFAAFLRPLRAAIKDQPDFGGLIPMPIRYSLPCYSDEIKLLYILFCEVFEKVQMCLDKMEGDLVMEETEDGGWDQYLAILKELRGIAKLYEGAEDFFWANLKRNKVSLSYLILRYATRDEDYKWILEHKELLDFESRRHLVMMLLPEMKDEYEELHEMLIDRSQLLAESFEYITRADPDMLRGGLFMEFKNEEATGPGVLREWFFLVCREIFNPQNALFVACPNDRRRFFPNPASKVDPLHLEYFNFAGRVIALALMHKVQVGILFDRAFFLQLGGTNIALEDIKDADPYLYSSCKKILDMDPLTVDQDALGLTFVREVEELGSMKVVELFADGKNIVVNSRNREEYVELLIQHRFVTSVAEQVNHFARGFADIVGEEKIQKLFFKSLELEDLDGMLHGSESPISVEDWKAHTEYNGYWETDPQIYWFWKIVGEMTAEQQKVLLLFWTSLKHLPVEGFEGLASKLYIYKSNDSLDLLPSSHTCFYRLCFPAYPSMGVMRERLNIITQDHVGCSFGIW